MSAGHRTLVWHCVALLDSYDPSSTAAEHHVTTYMQQQRGLEPNDEVFVTEVFSGCIRYTSVLSVVMTGFFNRDGKTLLRSSENLYRVFCYLALFRLDELGIGHFNKFLRTQDVNKMYKFLAFFINEKHLRTWMKDEWTKLYEHSFVQTKLLSPLLRWIPELQEVMQQMKKKIDNKLKPKKTTSATTEMKPFQLTQPRPRSVPIPEQIPKLQPHQPVPETTYKEPKEQEFLSKVKETNRRKAEERLMESMKNQFTCANPEKTTGFKEKLAQIRREQDDQLQFESHKSNPVPRNMLSENIPIKLNAAAILREGKLYKQREQEQLRKLEGLEAGENDGSRFQEWQDRMKRMDMEKELAAIEQRRLQGKLSKEEAILARQNVMKENRRKAEEMKLEAEHLMQIYMEKKLKEDAETRKRVEDVLDTHENAKEAKKRIQEYKASIVQQVTEESRELMRQALEEAETMMKQKMDLIRQIRAMEAIPINRFKLVDLSETAGYGFLNEMSIVELKERLALYKDQEKEKEEATRDEILAAKEAKDQLLMDTLQTISRHRTETSKAAAVRLETRKKNHNVPTKVQDEKVLELQKKLEEKRQQRMQEQESAKIRPDSKSIRRLKELNASKRVVEERRWQELERTREKTARLGSKGILSSHSAARIAGQPLLQY